MIGFYISNFIYSFVKILSGYLILNDLFISKYDKKKSFKYILLLATPISIFSGLNMQWYYYSNFVLIIECIYVALTASVLLIGKRRVIFVVNMFYQVSYVMINLFIMYLYCVITGDREVYKFINVASKQRYYFIIIDICILIIIFCLIHRFFKGNFVKLENYYIVLAGASVAIYFISAYYQEIYLNSITNILF